MTKEYIATSIVNQGKQFAVRIPIKIAKALNVDPKKDEFMFVFDREKLHLEGFLASKKKKNGKEKKT